MSHRRQRSDNRRGGHSELVAEALHQSSARAKDPFVAVNCAGHSRNAPRVRTVWSSGGVSPGPSGTSRALEMANGGTVFPTRSAR